MAMRKAPSWECRRLPDAGERRCPGGVWGVSSKNFHEIGDRVLLVAGLLQAPELLLPPLPGRAVAALPGGTGRQNSGNGGGGALTFGLLALCALQVGPHGFLRDEDDAVVDDLADLLFGKALLDQPGPHVAGELLPGFGFAEGRQLLYEALLLSFAKDGKLPGSVLLGSLADAPQFFLDRAEPTSQRIALRGHGDILGRVFDGQALPVQLRELLRFGGGDE